MPIPIYILAADYVVEDKTTGRSSIFNVIEKVTFSKIPKPAGDAASRVAVVKQSELVVSSFWHRGDGEIGDIEYELEFAINFHGSEKTVLSQTYTLSGSLENMRFNTHILGIPGVNKSGIAYLQHRARVAGAPEWSKQQYPVIVEEVEVKKGEQPKKN